MNYYKLFFSALLFTTLFLSACQKENWCDCIKRTGTITKEFRSLGAFNRVEAEDNLDVYISKDTVQEVVVEAGENILPLIETELQGQTLYIRNKNRCNWARSYTKPMNVYLKMREITYLKNSGTARVVARNVISDSLLEIETSGSGDVELTLNTQLLYTHLYGSGDIFLNGQTVQHYCDIGETAFLFADGLVANYSEITSTTVGCSKIKTTATLNCKIDGRGDVFCSGNPGIVKKTGNGPGNLYID